jgi:MFS family permease
MIESVHSPDRRYWWDGRKWQLAVSPDGYQWFDGIRWISNPLAPPRVRYRPTGWTRPLQAAVIALTVIAFATFVWTTALAASTFPAPVVVAGDVSPAQAAQLSRSFRASIVAGLVVNGVVLLALVALIVVGALKLWRWVFWLTLVGFGLVVTGPLVGLAASRLISIPPPPAGTRPPVPTFPLPIGLANVLVLPATLLLFVGMLVVAVRVGPWGCRKAVEERPDHEPPVTG